METRCPECEKRLRLPDTYAGQRIRCRNCSAIFRPTDVMVDTPVEVVPEPQLEYSPEPYDGSDTPAPAPTSPPTQDRNEGGRKEGGRKGGGGIGIAIVIAALLIGRLPRLFDAIFDGDRNRPEPVQLDDDELQALQDALEGIEDKLAEPEEERRDGEPLDLDAVPDGEPPRDDSS